ncbi:MAG: hypothetical protein ACK5MR_16650 [Cumulibacter sp.]
MARPRKEPDYDDSRTYPARDASSASDLKPFLDKIQRTLDGVNEVLDDPEATEQARTVSLLRAAKLARAQTDDLAHLAAEYAMRGAQGLTMKAAADNLGVNADTTYRWWHRPLSTDATAPEWGEQSS